MSTPSAWEIREWRGHEPGLAETHGAARPERERADVPGQAFGSGAMTEAGRSLKGLRLSEINWMIWVVECSSRRPEFATLQTGKFSRGAYGRRYGS